MTRLTSILCVAAIACHAAASPAAGGDLLVASAANHQILRYDAVTGAFIDAFVPASSGGLSFPTAATIGPDGNLYVSSYIPGISGSVHRYSGTTGAFIDVFVAPGSGGLNDPTYLVFGPDQNLYVSDFATGEVKRYNGTTGAFMGVFTTGVVACGCASGTGPANAIYTPQGLVFGPDGSLYVADEYRVLRFNGTTGALIDIFVPNGAGGLQEPLGLAFGPDGNLYVGGANSQSVVRFDGTTGVFIDVFVTSGSGGLGQPHGLAFGPGGDLYVADANNHTVLRYDGATGAFVSTFVPPGSGGLLVPEGILFKSVPNPNQPPTAISGANQTVRPGVTVQLDGSASFDDNTPSNLLQYTWTVATAPAGSAASLTSPNTAFPTFVPDVPGSYSIRLVVQDQGGLSSAPSDVLIGDNPPPTVNAGLDQLVVVSGVVSLVGAATDSPGETLTSSWTFSQKPAGSGAQFLNPTSLSTSFVPDVPGTYIARLTASDLLGPGAPDDVQITAATPASYAEAQTQAAAVVVAALPSAAVTTQGNQNALMQILSQANQASAAGDIAAAVQKLQQAISRTDGCALHGGPDGNGPSRDWVTTCTAQGQIYPLLLDALSALQP